MSVENLLSEPEIFEAEDYRVRGDYRRAIDMTRGAINFSRDELSSLSDFDKKRYLMQLGIYGLSTLNHANAAWHGDTVCERLQSVREALKNAYTNPAVINAAKTIDTDTRGNPYEFQTEFKRHRADYLLKCFHLTGNSVFLNGAVEILDEAIAEAKDENAKSLSIFVKSRLMDDYRMEKEAFNQVVATSPDNNERNATVGTRFAIDAFTSGKFKDAYLGLKIYGQAALSDHNTASILPREIVKWATNGIRHEIWRLTGKGDGYTRDLEL